LRAGQAAARGSEPPDTARLLRDGKLLWLDLEDAGEDGLELLRDVFQLHPLALEDVEEFGQRPKLVSGVSVLPGMTPEGEPYLRDLYDHLIRISDLVDSYRDLLSNAMDAYLSIVSNRLNEVMKQLTIIATIFLPLSFLTGFFGQNFGWMVSRLGGLPTFLLLGIGSELAAAAGLFTLFRRRGWF
jgi:Mg2+ and Co2+ transporter CorA